MSSFCSTGSQLFFLLRFIFRERGREGEGEGEEYQRVVAFLVPLSTGDLAHIPGMCPDWELNWQTPIPGLQSGTQSTEPQQQGQEVNVYKLLPRPPT